VRCREFPVVVITSSDDHGFPPAFLRRCLLLELPEPSPRMLAALVAAHFSQSVAELTDELIQQFQQHSGGVGGPAPGQLLDAVQLAVTGVLPHEDQESREAILDAVWNRLSGDDR
jgi:hypothetical protein